MVIVASLPPHGGFAEGRRSSPSGTSPLSRVSRWVEATTGFSSRMDEVNRTFASAGVEGTAALKPGTPMNMV